MQANKHLLLWSSLATLALLGWAAFAEHGLQEWRELQRTYRRLLPDEQRAAFTTQLRQVVVPRLGSADRCVSCHLGMATGETAIPGHAVFAAHPDVAHDTAAYGCTVCHGGQGRATDKDAAHGDVEHWPSPMIPRRYAWAACGSCHTHLAVPNLARLERGGDLFARHDCRACHRVDGVGGTLRPGGSGGMEGPDLSRVGIVGWRADWHEHHRTRHAAAADGPWREAFSAVDAADVAAIDTFLASRVGAPGLVEAKALFHSLGCRGCHPLVGVGGDDGPALDAEGLLDPGRLDFTNVPGKHDVSAWLAEHFRAPASVVPDSAMPALGLTEEQIDRLVFYMWSLRRREHAESLWPKDRILAERFGEREFAVDGATLYGTFCAACHGPAGQGMRYPGMAAFPAIGNPDFLRRVSDEFVRETIRRGRPGRRMPAWGEKEGGLSPSEIDSLVAWLREMAGGVAPVPDPRPRRWVRGDAARGAALYRANCAACHGEHGAGAEGTALANHVFLETATDTYLVDTIRLGRRGTAMPAFGDPSPVRQLLSQQEIESIVAHVRSWEEGP